MNKFNNLLNLKKKDPSDIVYVEKIVLKNRSIFFELSRMLIIIAVASGIVWGFSNADDIAKLVDTKPAGKNFSAIGIVSNITGTSISLDDAKTSDQTLGSSFTFDISKVEKIETAKYVPLQLSDISIGDKIVTQGLNVDGTIEIRRIISFTATSSKVVVATTTATSTEATTTVTTTDITDASTTASTTDASSTPSILDNVTNAVGGVINTITGAAQNVINSITGSSTATSTDDTASSTVATTTEPVATSTPDTATTTVVTPDATPTPVVAPDATPTPDVVTPPVTDPAPAPTDTPAPASDTSGN